MNQNPQQKKPNTAIAVLIMAFVILLGISALNVWKKWDDARLAQRLTEIQVSDEDADKISYEIDDGKIHVLTPYYSFDLPLSWLGYCSLDYEPMTNGQRSSQRTTRMMTKPMMKRMTTGWSIMSRSGNQRTI